MTFENMTIGLILKQLDVEYQTTVYKGVREASSRLGFNLVCIQGETFEPTRDPDIPQYPACSFLPLDGILILSSIMIDNSNREAADRLKHAFGEVPVVSMGTTLAGRHHLLVDFDKAIHDLMYHLVVDHGYRKLLYLGGPKTNRDNSIRESGILRFFERYCKTDPGMTLTMSNGPIFSERTGSLLVRDHIQAHPQRDVDVILAGSDDLAAGVIKYLRNHASQEWAECPVTGVDDIPRSALMDPPLTTIRQPLFELGYRSVEIINGLIGDEGTAIPDSVQASLVVRESCGCPGTGNNQPVFPAGHWLREEQLLRDTGQLGVSLMTVTSMAGLISPLGDFLTGAGVHNFQLLVFSEPDRRIPDHGRLVFSLLPEGEKDLTRDPVEVDLKDYFRALPGARDSGGDSFSLVHLRSGEEHLGLLFYTSQDHVQPFMSQCSIFLAHTLKRLQVLEREKAYTRDLEKKVSLRTRELAEEARRRIAVEAEVVKISEMERMRFSMDLHDDICQRLAGMAMICGNVESDDPQWIQLSGMLTETLVKTRRYAHESFPMEIETLDFIEALRQLCSGVDGLGGCRCLLTPDPYWPDRFGQKEKINVYRIIQEALHNAIAHSGGTVVSVTLQKRGPVLIIHVRDNGSGSSVTAGKGKKGINQRRPRGLGLKSMEYRAHQLGGQFKLNSVRGKGTLLEIRIPLEGGEE
jgi:signal transduction histidine kinase/DNA-binding LacI/PurR family transcriptional regulator